MCLCMVIYQLLSIKIGIYAKNIGYDENNGANLFRVMVTV